MKIVDTFEAKIYVGTMSKDRIKASSRFYDLVRIYCNQVGLCVTITETNFFYTNGSEPGYMIGLINYPRFPSSPEEITKKALELAEIAKTYFEQERV
jgi:hypothetical protein